MKTQITFPVPIPDPSGHLIEMIHEKLTIEKDLELTQVVKLRFWTNVEGSFGIPLLESIDLNPNLTTDQKIRQKKLWNDQFRKASTRGYMVNASGELVYPDDNGQYPEGSFPEKVIWLNVLAEQVPGDLLSEKVFALILQSMGKMAQRNRI